MGICPTRSGSTRTVLENSPEPASAAPDSVTVSLHNYPSFAHTELSLVIGERLDVISSDGDFMTVRSCSTGRESYVPNNYTSRVSHGWLFLGISRFKAVELLMLPNNHKGAFLVRESETSIDSFSLSVLWTSSSSQQDCVKHYRICRLQNRWLYISPALTFPSLQHLVQHYSESSDGLCCLLRRPCFIRGLDGPAQTRPAPVAVRRPTINWKDVSRSAIFRRKRSGSENSLVSEGLREAISSYIQLTEGTDHGWDS